MRKMEGLMRHLIGVDFYIKYLKDPYTVFVLLDYWKNRCCYAQNQ